MKWEPKNYVNWRWTAKNDTMTTGSFRFIQRLVEYDTIFPRDFFELDFPFIPPLPHTDKHMIFFFADISKWGGTICRFDASGAPKSLHNDGSCVYNNASRNRWKRNRSCWARKSVQLHGRVGEQEIGKRHADLHHSQKCGKGVEAWSSWFTQEIIACCWFFSSG